MKFEHRLNAYKVQHYAGDMGTSKMDSDYEAIRKELHEVSASLQVNAEAMALLASISGDAKQEPEVNASYIRAVPANQQTGSDQPKLQNLKDLFLLFGSRTETLKKRLMEARAEASLQDESPVSKSPLTRI